MQLPFLKLTIIPFVLPQVEVENLITDIRLNLELGDHKDYWASLLVVGEEELERQRSMVCAVSS